MAKVLHNAKNYASTVSHYDAEIYIKGRAEILRSNYLIRFANRIFPVDRKTPDMVFELISQTCYEAPRNFTHKLTAINGSKIPNRKKQQEILNFLNLNMYSPTAFHDEIIMPTAPSAMRLYHFELVETIDTTETRLYKIRFFPKQITRKLMMGYLYIRDGFWSIQKAELIGRLDFAEFRINASFFSDQNYFMLPEETNLTLKYRLLGNNVESTYHSHYTYKAITWDDVEQKRKRQSRFDLTQYYSVDTAAVPIVTDSDFWEEKRDIPLNEEEEYLYEAAHVGKTGTVVPAHRDTTEAQRLLKVGEDLTSSVNFALQGTTFRYSGLLNPGQISYSARNGITYKQRLRIQKRFADGTEFWLRPELGYVFKTKELFYKVPGEWVYLPEKMGKLSIMAANGNRSYSNSLSNSINEQLKDSSVTFEDLNLDYYKDNYIELENQIELTNGLLLATGISYHYRAPVKSKKEETKHEVRLNSDVEDIAAATYNDFVPVISLSYTPRQYYWKDHRMKEYLYSRYPTITFEYARAIPGVFGSVGDYERFEMDVHQKLSIGPSKYFSYRVSGGLFSKQKSMYFADFHYFARRYFPDSWNDPIGGVFYLLDSEWYNASDKYIQMHTMLELPFIIFRIFDGDLSRYILSERLYLSHLYTPAKQHYTEIGYGIGNHLFNIAAFASFDKFSYQRFGVRFTIELFD